ncbi:hypothetical protein ONZ45_g12290 [Pleurotus djamor]|nr:hypothetical protein ONZ45_g12290 [Pleurotus djamor]
MHFQVSFTTLLATLLVALYANDVDALPTKRGVGMVSLPFRRVQPRTDVHPHILLQQHINRSHRRFARMTGRDGPSDADLASNLAKRMLSLPADAELVRRFNTAGTKGKYTQSQPNLSGASISTKANSGTDASNSTDGTVIAATNAEGVTEIEIDALINGGVTPAATPTADNSLGLDIIANDVGYFAPVKIGTPPREFRILMDSGSADMWVGAEDCVSETGAGCGNHLFLGNQSSVTFNDSGIPWQITYGTGAVSGTIVKDNVNIAGLALDDHIFGVATLESNEFAGDNVAFDGLLGTARSQRLSNQRAPTPVEALAQTGLIRQAITSYKMPRLADQNNDGVITFGGVDESKFQANTLVTLDNISPVGFWEAEMDQITVNGVDTAIDGAESDGQGGFIIPCNTNATISLTFGGRPFTIDPRDLVFAPLNINDPTGRCFSGITAGSIGEDTQWLVGDVFLKNAYFSHNVDTNTMTLAELTS